MSIHSYHHCSPVEGVDIKDVDQMQELLKKIILNMRGAEELAAPEPGEADGEDDKALKSSRGREGGGNFCQFASTLLLPRSFRGVCATSGPEH